jgi:hypothetical protein
LLANELIVIDSISKEHEAIRAHMRTVCHIMDGWEDTDWEELDSPDQDLIASITDKHMNLKQTINYLVDGLKGHYVHEESEIPGLVGSPLVESIRIEHNEILKQLEEINFFLINVNPRGFLANSSYLKLIIDNLCRLVDENNDKEDMILKLLKRRFI